MPTIRGLSGTSYVLEDKPFATGGEGYVYAVRSGAADSVAKIYRMDVGLTEEGLRHKGEKIRAMVQCPKTTLNKLGQFTAWPMDALLDERGSVVGFIMKRFTGVKDLEILLPMAEYADQFKRAVIAYNLCDVVEEVHGIGQCIGDMRPSNFGVDPNSGRVCAFDADSFHINFGNGYFPCTVGLPEYYAPELLNYLHTGAGLSTLDPRQTFNQNTDRFALAVLIFRLLMDNQHPFTPAWDESVEPLSAKENIRRGQSPYFNPTPGMHIPVNSPPMSVLSTKLKALFRKALLTDKRPSPGEWKQALSEYANALNTCANGHRYWGSGKCPWCAREEAAQKRTTYTPKSTGFKVTTAQASQPKTTTAQASQFKATTSQASQFKTTTAQASQPKTTTASSTPPKTTTVQPKTTTATAANTTAANNASRHWRGFEWCYFLGAVALIFAMTRFQNMQSVIDYDDAAFSSARQLFTVAFYLGFGLLGVGLLAQFGTPVLPAGTPKAGSGIIVIILLLFLTGFILGSRIDDWMTEYVLEMQTVMAVGCILSFVDAVALIVRKRKEP